MPDLYSQLPSLYARYQARKDRSRGGPFGDPFGDPFGSKDQDPFGDPFDLDKAERERISPDEQTFLGSLGRLGMSSLQTVGHVLDTPGAMVRSLLSGHNPFAAAIDPESRVYGADLFGKDPGFLGHAAGFGIDVLTDPLSWFGPGLLLKGMGKAGSVASKIGLMKSLPGAAGGLVPAANRSRRALLENTPRTLLDALEKAEGPAARAAKETEFLGKAGKRGASLLDDQLGGPLGFRVPFTDAEWWAKPGNRVAEKLADFGDTTGRTLRTGGDGSLGSAAASSLLGGGLGLLAGGPSMAMMGAATGLMAPPLIGRATKALGTLFDARNLGATTEGGQMLGKRISEGGKTGEAAGKQAGLETELLWNRDGTLKGLSNEEARGLLEYGMPSDPQARAALHAYGPSDKYLGHVQQTGASRGYWPEADLQDVTGARHVPRFTAPNEGATGYVMHGGQMSPPGTTEGRLDPLKNLDQIPGLSKYGGSEALVQIGRKVAPILEDAAITDKQGAIVTELKRLGVPDEQIITKTGEQTGGRHKELANIFISQGPKRLREGLYPHHPVADIVGASAAIGSRFEMRDRMLQGITDDSWVKLVQSQAKPGEASHALPEVLKQLGYHDPQKAMEFIAKQRGGNIAANMQAIADIKLPDSAVADLGRIVKGVDGTQATSDVLNVYDWFTNTFRAGVTAWPAFATRNFISGQFQNWIHGMFSFWSNRDARRLANGQSVAAPEKFASHPEVQAALQRLGLQETPENITEVIRSGFGARGIVAQGVEEITTGAPKQAKTLEDVGRSVPGRQPLPGAKEIAKTFAGREEGSSFFPFSRGKEGWQSNLAGVGAATEDKFVVTRGMKKINQAVENQNRVAPALELLAQGHSFDEAAAKVMAAQVNYANKALTPFEQKFMTRVFPFYRFTRGMLPHTLAELVSKPGGRLGQTIRGQIALQKSGGEGGPLPPQVSDTAAVPITEGNWLSKLVGGPQKGGQRYLTGLGLMHEDAIKLLGPLAAAAPMIAAQATPIWPGAAGLYSKFGRAGQVGGALAEQVGMGYSALGGTLPLTMDALLPWGAMARGPGLKDLGLEMWSRANPLVKAMYEVPSGQLAFQRGREGGRQISEMEGPLQGIAANIMGTERPLPRPSPLEYLIGASPLSRAATTLRTVTDPRKGAVAKAANTLSGMQITDVPAASIDHMLSQEIADRMRDIGGKGFTKTYFSEADLKKMPPQQRQQAMELMYIQNLLEKKKKLRQKQEKKTQAA